MVSTILEVCDDLKELQLKSVDEEFWRWLRWLTMFSILEPKYLHTSVYFYIC